MKIYICIDEIKLRQLIYNYITNIIDSTLVDKDKIFIEVKSKQNYQAEWERAAFRAIYEQNL